MKTTLAIVLAVLLSLAVMNFDAHTVNGSIRSTGNIEFEGSISSGLLNAIFDPKEIGLHPDIPAFTPEPDEIGRMKNIDSMSLAFGNTLAISDNNRSYPSINKAGFIVSANSDWRVTVKISGFKQGDEQTLEGFVLTLTPEGGGVNISQFASIQVPTSVELAAGPGGATGTEAQIASGNPGVMGCQYSGSLLVRGKTAKPGNASATLWWTIITGP